MKSQDQKPYPSAAERFSIRELAPPKDVQRELEDDVRLAFTGNPKQLAPKYFYDARGSELFVDITRTEDYYPTRIETALLEAHARELVQAVGPEDLLEIGSGASRKTQVLLEALGEIGGRRYIAFDISKDAIEDAAQRLTQRFDWLEVLGLVGDFHTDLVRIKKSKRRLISFLGSTLGNLIEEERTVFFRDLRRTLGPNDAFLLGIDLLKPVEIIERAYNDSAGITAEFNKNVLHVLNRRLDGDLPIDRFDHMAKFDREQRRVVSSLRAQTRIDGRFAKIDLDYHFEAGEQLFTEVSTKFERRSLTQELEAAGLTCERWIEDEACPYALALIR